MITCLRRRLLATLVLTLTATPSAFAGIPSVPAIPDALPDSARATLTAERASLIQQKQALVDEGGVINRDCARVERDSAEYRECLTRQNAFASHLADLRTAVEGLSHQIDRAVVAETQRLATRDRELTAAIDRDVTAIRRLGLDSRAEDFAEWEKLGANAQHDFEMQLKDQLENVLVSQGQAKVSDIFKDIDDAHLERLIHMLEKADFPKRSPMLSALRQLLAAGSEGRAHMVEQASIISTGIERGLQGAASTNLEERLQFASDFVCDAAETTKVLAGCHLLKSELQVVSAALYSNAARRVAISQVERLTQMTEAQLQALNKIDALLKRHVAERNEVRSALNALR